MPNDQLTNNQLINSIALLFLSFGNEPPTMNYNYKNNSLDFSKARRYYYRTSVDISSDEV
jgi:hypothetical protein